MNETGSGISRYPGLLELMLDDGIDIRMHACGISMFPVISTGDRIIVRPGKNHAVGDIVIFRRDEELLCHRLEKIFEEEGARFCQTRGDSFISPDNAVPVGLILGKVVKVERGEMSFARKTLLLLYPVFRFGKMNAFLVSAAVSLRKQRLPGVLHRKLRLVA